MTPGPFFFLAASAYEDVPWINELVDWVAWLAKSKPGTKIVGRQNSSNTRTPYFLIHATSFLS